MFHDLGQPMVADQNDRQIRVVGEARCHDGAGILHRAFSSFASLAGYRLTTVRMP